MPLFVPTTFSHFVKLTNVMRGDDYGLRQKGDRKLLSMASSHKKGDVIYKLLISCDSNIFDKLI